MLNIIKILLISIVFISCSATNYTMNISAQSLQENLQKRFPIKKDVIMGTMSLKTPLIKLDDKKNRIITGLNFEYKPPFFSAQNGKLVVSGKVNYNKEKAAFYLQNPLIENISFNDTSIGSMVPNTLKNMMGSFVNELFKNYPIYKIEDNDFKSKIYKKTLKSVEVKDGKLALTLGL